MPTTAVFWAGTTAKTSQHDAVCATGDVWAMVGDVIGDKSGQERFGNGEFSRRPVLMPTDVDEEFAHKE